MNVDFIDLRENKRADDDCLARNMCTTLTSTLRWTEVQTETEDRLQDSRLLPGVDVDAVKLSDPLRPDSSKTLLQLTHTQPLTQQAPALTHTHTQITAPPRVRANELVEGGWAGG